MNSRLKVHRPRPVLMIPLRRCGSHALRLRLNNSEEFYSPYPLHIVDMIPALPRYGDLSVDQNYFQLVVDVIGLQAVSMVKWDGIVFDPVDVFDSLKDKERSVHAVVWELLVRSGEKQSAKVVMDKSLDSVHYADELMRLHPDMLFLNVVRDPRAQVASMNKAIIHDFDSRLNALTWRRAHEKAQDIIRKYSDRVLTIRYEDFLLDQESVLLSICNFFGIRFNESMLDVANSKEATKISQRSALWESNCFPPIAANKDKFRQSLSIEDIESVETICAPFMQEYGYEFMTAASYKHCEEEIRLAEHKSIELRSTAWENLRVQNYQDYILRRQRIDFLNQLKAREPWTI